MLWKKKGSLDEIAPNSPAAIRMGISAASGYKSLVILPNDPISQDFSSKIDSLCKDAGSETATLADYESVAEVLGNVVSHFGDAQRKAVEKSISATYDSLREILLSLDGSASSGDELARRAESTTTRLTSLETAESFEAIVKGLKEEVASLTAAIEVHKENSKTIRKVCSTQIDDLRSKLRVAERSVRTDHLTKLSNRSAFEFILATAIHRCAFGEEFYLAILDLNHFKNINDTHGHLAGDAALATFAAKLNETFGILGGNGTQIARLGGDEFAVVFKGTALQLAAKLERVNSTLTKRPMVYKSAYITIQASYGMVQLRQNHTLESAYHEADIRMYDHKQTNKAA